MFMISSPTSLNYTNLFHPLGLTPLDVLYSTLNLPKNHLHFFQFIRPNHRSTFSLRVIVLNFKPLGLHSQRCRECFILNGCNAPFDHVVCPVRVSVFVVRGAEARSGQLWRALFVNSHGMCSSLFSSKSSLQHGHPCVVNQTGDACI